VPPGPQDATLRLRRNGFRAKHAKRKISKTHELESGEDMTLKPLDDRIVVEPTSAEERTAGGIVLPDAAQEKSQRGKVIAVGPGRILDGGKRAEVSVKVGDEVLFGKYGGTEIEVDGKDLKILRESDILAKVVK
jgi:chaperonin GroES